MKEVFRRQQRRFLNPGEDPAASSILTANAYLQVASNPSICRPPTGLSAAELHKRCNHTAKRAFFGNSACWFPLAHFMSWPMAGRRSLLEPRFQDHDPQHRHVRISLAKRCRLISHELDLFCFEIFPVPTFPACLSIFWDNPRQSQESMKPF